MRRRRAERLADERENHTEGLAVLEAGELLRAARALVLVGATDDRVSLLPSGLEDRVVDTIVVTTGEQAYQRGDGVARDPTCAFWTLNRESVRTKAGLEVARDGVEPSTFRFSLSPHPCN